jgi:very-short-patch-repair endonuclease
LRILSANSINSTNLPSLDKEGKKGWLTLRVHNRKYLKKTRKDLRNNSTPAEAILWNALKCKKICNKKFRRQHSILDFVVDFYCPSDKLIIEVDGGAHDDIMTELSDFERDNKLTELGFLIIRFSNDEVYNNLEWVLEEIKENLTTP